MRTTGHVDRWVMAPRQRRRHERCC